jgi:hypothetical protein
MDILGKIPKLYLPYLLGTKQNPMSVPLGVKESARFANLGYKKPEDRPKEVENYGKYMNEFSNKDVAIYKDDKNKQMNIAIRGSDFSQPIKDLVGDIGLIAGKLDETPRYKEVVKTIEMAKKNNPEYKTKSISHSLGASTGRLLVEKNIIDKAQGFSEGISPFFQPKDNRNVQSIRFKSDIISYPNENKGVISLDPTKPYAHGLGGFF